ncbi:hypothetical protein Aduo_011937 [Ancylostoma duodenale]
MKVILLLLISLTGLEVSGNVDKEWMKCITCLFVVNGLEIFPVAYPQASKERIKGIICEHIENHHADNELTQVCEDVVDEIYGNDTKESELKRLSERPRNATVLFCRELSGGYCIIVNGYDGYEGEETDVL